jgi:hypothetical protein
LSSYAQFVKEIGDGTLFIFSSFEDLHAWWSIAENNFSSYNQEWENELKEELFAVFNITAKTVVHLGEVSYITKGNPLSLAVNQVFKIEKLFGAGQLGCTDAVRSAAVPHFDKLKIKPRRGEDVTLPGDDDSSPTWILSTSNLNLHRENPDLSSTG